jgi:hypothetical protein
MTKRAKFEVFFIAVVCVLAVCISFGATKLAEYLTFN